ncbi:uncharacterized protein LOC142168336 [Nicotiana tabacum]|uniref:Uncharacterized protein LOC142168336 n=1 Tax=Nicotiana tabacum TaxID=4097 RepID=A0AC58SJF8_TOBAC
MLDQYKADVEVVETHLRTKTEYMKRMSRRETLGEIPTRGFNLSAKIEEAKRLVAEAKEHYEPECSKSSEGSEGSGGSSAESSSVNAKAKNLLYNAISGEEYGKISSCETAKEMWDKLEVTYEGTNKVKEIRINLLVPDSELFHMKDGESVENIFSRFSKIIGYLKSFGKTIKNGEQVRKILRSLPKIWQPKVIALECQDLDKMSYDELRSDLILFEKTHLDMQVQQEKRKTVAFKTIVAESENEDEEEGEEQDMNIAMLSKVVNNMMERNIYTRKGKSNFRKDKINNDNEKNDGKCYECGKDGHIQAECPELKKKLSRNFQKKKSFVA